MPRIAVKLALTANDNPLPNFWEFFSFPNTRGIDEIDSINDSFLL